MQLNTYYELQTKYGLKDYEINCILLNMALQNQQLSYAGTIALVKKTKSMQQAGHYFFNKLEVKKFMHEVGNDILNDTILTSDVKIVPVEKKDNGKQKKQFAIPGESQELTKENIKQVLESELSKITEPEKRTALLIRITDLLSLQNNNSNELERPVIYLPGEVNLVPL